MASVFLRHVQERTALARPSTFVDSRTNFHCGVLPLIAKENRMARQDADYTKVAGESAEEMAGKVTEQAFTEKAHQSAPDRFLAS